MQFLVEKALDAISLLQESFAKNVGESGISSLFFRENRFLAKLCSCDSNSKQRKNVTRVGKTGNYNKLRLKWLMMIVIADCSVGS